MEIQQKFLIYLDLERLTGEHIAQKVLDYYEKSRVNPKQCRSQCYDGAPNIQTEKKRVASFILNELENAAVSRISICII